VPKQISKRCELGKLCRINRSGPVFLRQCRYLLTITNVNYGILINSKKTLEI